VERILLVAAFALGLTACGMAAPPAAGGAVELKQAEQAKGTEERVRQQVEEAGRAAEQQRRDAESQGQ
jgi:hypothetical protein